MNTADLALAHRYLYYVAMIPIISDEEYDALKQLAVEEADKDHLIHGVGSSNAEDYPKNVIAIAFDLLGMKPR